MAMNPATSHPKSWTKPYLLLGGIHSYFTGKLRCYMDYRRVPYTEVASTMKIYPFIKSSTKVNFIPVVVTPDGTVLQDTTDIIDYFEALPGLSTPPALPATPCQRVASLLVELFADEWMVLQAMHFRWSFREQRRFVGVEFGRLVAPWTSGEERQSLADMVMSRFAGSLPFLGVHESTVPAVEAEYHHLLDVLDDWLDGNTYLLGDRPTLADFALQGPMFAHLYRDPVPGSIMKMKAPNVAHWVERCVGVPAVLAQDNPRDLTPDGEGIAAASGPPAHIAGSLLEDKDVPSAVIAILRMMVDTQLDVIFDTSRRTAAWIAENPGNERLPRSLGTAEFSMPRTPAKSASEVGTAPRVTATRAVFPFVLWMAQRVTDTMNGLGADDRKAVDAMLDRVAPGTAAKFRALSTQLETSRVRRDGSILVVDSRPRPKL